MRRKNTEERASHAFISFLPLDCTPNLRLKPHTNGSHILFVSVLTETSFESSNFRSINNYRFKLWFCSLDKRRLLLLGQTSCSQGQGRQRATRPHRKRQGPGHQVSDTFQEPNTSSSSYPHPPHLHQLTFFSGKKNLQWKESIFRFYCWGTAGARGGSGEERSRRGRSAMRFLCHDDVTSAPENHFNEG